MAMIRFFIYLMFAFTFPFSLCAEQPEEQHDDDITFDLRFIETEEIEVEEPVYEKPSTTWKYCQIVGIWLMMRVMNTHEWCQTYYKKLIAYFKNNHEKD